MPHKIPLLKPIIYLFRYNTNLKIVNTVILRSYYLSGKLAPSHWSEKSIMISESRILKLLPNKLFGRRFGLLTKHGLIGQIVSLATLPILSHLYSTYEVGRLGLFLSFLNLVAVMSCLRFEVGIVTADNNKSALDSSFLCLLTMPLLSLFYALLLIMLIKNHLLGFDHLTYAAAPLAFIGIIITGCSQIFHYFLIRETSFNLEDQTPTKQNIFRAFIQIVSGIIGINYIGLIVGDLIGNIIGMKKLSKKFFHTLKETKYKPSLKQIIHLANSNKFYPFNSLPATVISTLAFTAPIPLLAQAYGIRVAGLYAFANRVLAIPSYFIGRSVADKFHSQSISCLQQNPQELKKLFLKTTKLLFRIGLIPFLLCIVISPWAFRYLFGNSWEAAGVIAAIISPWAFAQFVITPVSRIVFVTGKKSVKLFYDFLALFAVIGGINIGKYFGLNTIWAIALMSGLSFVAYIIYFILLCFSNNMFIKQRLNDQASL